MNENIRSLLIITGYIFSIILSVWMLLGGIPYIVSFIGSTPLQAVTAILLIPLIPMLPGIFTGSYALPVIPRVYLYEFLDMYLAVFFLVIYFPLVAVQTFSVIVIIALSAAVIVLLVWIINACFGIHTGAGLRYEDFLLLAVLIEGGLLLLLVIRYSSFKIEKIADTIEEGTTGALDTMFKYMKMRRERINSLKKKKG